jgi:YVTN family beta-propeller protein
MSASLRRGSLLVFAFALVACPQVEHVETDAQRIEGPGSANHDLDASARDVLPGVDLVADADARSSPFATLGQKLYVTNAGSRDLTVIDALDLKSLGTVPLEGQPRCIARAPNSSTVYVAVGGANGENEGHLAVVDSRSGTLAASLPGGRDPQQLAITADGKDVYVASGVDGTLSMFDLEKKALGAPTLAGKDIEGLSLSPDGNWIYVTRRGARLVAVFDRNARKLVAEVKLAGHPSAVRFLPDDSLAFVVTTAAPSVTVLSLPAHKIEGTISVGTRPYDVAVADDGKRAYVTDEAGEVFAIDTSKMAVIGHVPVGKDPHGIAISPDGKNLYVANHGSDDLSVIDSEAMRERAKIPAGQKPTAVVLVPQPD